MRRVPVTEIGLSEIPVSSRIALGRGCSTQSMSAAACSGSLLELDPGVEVLGVLADDDEVDVSITGTHAL